MKEPDRPVWTSPPQLAARPGSTTRRNATIGGGVVGVVVIVVALVLFVQARKRDDDRRAAAEAESKHNEEFFQDQMRECTLDTIPSGVPIYKFAFGNEEYLGDTPITRMKLVFEHKAWTEERFEARPPGRAPITLDMPDCPDAPLMLLAEQPL